MCLTIPGQVKEINKDNYVVQYGPQEIKVPNTIIKNIEEGDWVMVQNKTITQKISPKQAQDFFKLMK
ncbi:MAG: HypC/HybG/HupF family hydrogenase formation chaperone [Patescibacteria group bacterium]|jgi:hydrogenase maturation factor